MPAWATIIPNDPLWQQWAFSDLGVVQAWEYTVGSENVIVAVIDNGFDQFHPDLLGNVWKNVDEIEDNGIDDDKNGYSDDVWGWNFVAATTTIKKILPNGEVKEGLKWIGNNNPRPEVATLSQKEKNEGVFHHGTAVAGLIGARGNNGKAGAGIAWNVKLMNIKVVGNKGETAGAPLAEAIHYAVDNGAHIINTSVVTDGLEAVNEAVRYAYDKGVVFIAAVGNAVTEFSPADLNARPLFPVCVDAKESKELLLGVSAIDEAHHITSFSNYGSQCVDVAAPGVAIKSTLRYSPSDGLTEQFGGRTNNELWAGTSFAAPLVTGAAVLVKSVQPNWLPDQIFKAILSTTQHTPGQDEEVYAQLFGSGLLQVGKAVKFAFDQPGSVKPIAKKRSTSWFVYQPKNGQMSEWKSDKDTKIIFTKIGLQSVIDARVTDVYDKIWQATVKQEDKKNIVRVYTEGWRLLHAFSLETSESVHITIGDIVGDAKPEIIVAPTEPSTIVFSLYQLDGQFLSAYMTEQLHQGVSLSTMSNGNGRSDVIVAFKKGMNVVVERLSGTETVKSSFVIKELNARGTVGAGDIDGDGKTEFIVGAGPGETPFLAYYDVNGKNKRKFYAFQPSYKAGFDLLINDYNGDGKDDAIVAPLAGGEPVRVFNERAKKIVEWWPFEPGKLASMRLIGTR